MKQNLILSLALSLVCMTTHAALSPVAVSIAGPAQFPSSKFDVTGARISAVYGEHRDVSGIDLGLAGNVTTGKFKGLAVSGLFNYTKGETLITGLQFAGLTNLNKQKTQVYGIQAALLANYNNAESSVNGLQFALANLSSHTTIRGFQMGLYNSAREVYGFQIGLINRAENLHGIQIGLLNFHQKGLFVVSPILNVGF